MALLQLAAHGPQDLALTGSPSTSCFRGRYKRHTPFATEYKDMVFDSEPGFGSRAVVKIARLGDLVHSCVLQVTMRKTGTTFYPLEQFVKSVDVVIGGMVIDSHDSTWFRLYDEMYRKEDHRLAYRELADFSTEPVGSVKTLYLPLIFWFCRDPSHSLSLLSLQHHEVELVFTFASHVDGIDLAFPPRPKVVGEYVYLDCSERERVATSRHVLLIEQLQRTETSVPISTAEKAVARVELTFNHVCKSLVWAFCHPTMHGVFNSNLRGLEASECFAPMAAARLSINGVDRTEDRPGSWHRIIESFARTKQIPSAGVYAMHFCLRPDSSTVPSGSINLSRLNGALHFTMKRAVPGSTHATLLDDASTTLEAATQLTTLRIYAQSWNQLVLDDGMGGLQWAS